MPIVTGPGGTAPCCGEVLVSRIGEHERCRTVLVSRVGEREGALTRGTYPIGELEGIQSHQGRFYLSRVGEVEGVRTVGVGLAGEHERVQSHQGRFYLFRVGEKEGAISYQGHFYLSRVGEKEGGTGMACPRKVIPVRDYRCDRGIAYVTIQEYELFIVGDCIDVKAGPVQYDHAAGCCDCTTVSPGSGASVGSGGGFTSGSGAMSGGSGGGGCTFCTITPSAGWLTLSGGTGNGRFFNGSWGLTRVGPCEWQGTFLVDGLPLSIDYTVGAGGWDAVLSYGGAGGPIYQARYHGSGASLPDCCVPVNLTLVECLIGQQSGGASCRACCDGASPERYTLGVEGMTGDYATFNGAWVLQGGAGSCVYTAARASDRGPIQQLATFFISFVGRQDIGIFASASIQFDDSNTDTGTSIGAIYGKDYVGCVECCDPLPLDRHFFWGGLGTLPVAITLTPGGDCGSGGSGPGSCPPGAVWTPDCATGGIPVTCCPGPIPTTLKLTVTGSGDCDGDYEIIYDPAQSDPFPAWICRQTVGNCGGPPLNPPTFRLVCISNLGIWQLSTPEGTEGLAPTTVDCGPPMILTWTGVNLSSCDCGTSATITVTVP